MKYVNVIYWMLVVIAIGSGLMFCGEMAYLTISSGFTMSAWQMIPHTWHYLVVAMVTGSLWAWLDNILKGK